MERRHPVCPSGEQRSHQDGLGTGRGTGGRDGGREGGREKRESVDGIFLQMNRRVHVKHERIHYCRNEHAVTAGVHSSTILAGICIAFYGNVVQL